MACFLKFESYFIWKCKKTQWVYSENKRYGKKKGQKNVSYMAHYDSKG